MSNPTSMTRNIAFIGIHHSGKTSLTESILFLTGAISRRGKTLDGTSTADHSPESIARQMSTAVSVVNTKYRDYHFNILDCPGFIDFTEEVKLALLGVDTAIFVIEPDPARLLQIEPLLRYTESIGIASMVFVNKVDKQDTFFEETLEALLAMPRPGKGRLVPVHFPIKTDDVFGYADILKVEAFKYSSSGKAEKMNIPSELGPKIAKAHELLLECLADVDDDVLEMVVEGKEPPLNVMEKDLKSAVQKGALVPILVGSAHNDAGILCLLDAIIALCPTPFCHDYRDCDGNLLELKEDGPVIAQVIKTYVHPQFGKLSVSRVFSGTINANLKLHNTSIEGSGEERIGGLYQLQGKKQESIQSAGPGSIVAIARLEKARTGDTLTSNGCTVVLNKPPLPPPLYVLAIAPKSHDDEAKVMGLITKLLEEDPTLTLDWNADLHEHRLGGQGEVLLSVSLQRLERQYHLQVNAQKPKVAYREAIQASVETHGRHKKQSGGHGQFGEVYLRIEPAENGSGNQFSESIVGGAIPQQYIPGVEKGVMEALQRGPLAGFPMVDVSVNLFDGSFHDVDSDEMSFRTAAIQAIRDGVPKADPRILEPIASVVVVTPSQHLSAVLSQITRRRGQILGYSARENEPGWDEVTAFVPQAELWDYIIELRTITSGLGFYHWEFAHLAPVPAAIADELQHKEAVKTH